MAEEFQSEVCNGSWWTSPRATFNNSSFMAANYGGCWQNDFMNNLKTTTRSTDESSPDSAFQVITSSPSTTTNWNQALLVNGRNQENQENYNQTLPEILNNQDSLSFGMDQQQQTNSYGYPSSLLQTLFDGSTPPVSPPSTLPQQPLYDFQMNMNEFNSVSSMPSFSSLEKPKQQVLGGLHLANKTPFWNSSALDLNDNRAAFYASTQSQYLSSSTYGEKPNCPNIKSQSEEIRHLESSLKKGSSETTFKRPRLETPSPLPTFKVRKEKLGDRVTALQQLVSPFGKTDTASVLHEAIEYIKLLHDQVNVLSTPYMKNGTMQPQEIHGKVKDNGEEAKQQDLRGRGLCLVPVSSTFPVATETAPDYWTSSFGGTFR